MTDLTKTIQALRSQMRTWWLHASSDGGGKLYWRNVAGSSPQLNSDGTIGTPILVNTLPADAVLKALEVACEALATIECGLVTVGAAKYAGFKPKAIAFQSLEEIARVLETK